jgi:dTDP-4-amino-4,6-dideoxygalactose transaminase
VSSSRSASLRSKWEGDLEISFTPIKNMTTGEGGMIVTNNAEYAEKLRMLRPVP